MSNHIDRIKLFQKIVNKNLMNIHDFERFIFTFWSSHSSYLQTAHLEPNQYLNPNAVIIWSESLCQAVVCCKHAALRLNVLHPLLKGHEMQVKRTRLVENGTVGAILVKIEDYIEELPREVTSLQYFLAKIQNPLKWNIKSKNSYPGIQDLLDAMCYQD